MIVESPAKARTIARYLGDDYIVQASVGHIRDIPVPRDLPAEMKKGPYGKFGVDVEGDFDPYYIVSPDKKKTVAELKKALKDAETLYLATDEDREGEAIAWHLLETLKPKKSLPVKRMVFHEITKDAILAALENTREIDSHLVDAQETRRILDRLVGFELSPVLWRKIKPSLSAGRVQSVATRLVVERERERMAFVAADYWDITGTFGAEAEKFSAKIQTVDGARVASGSDFADDGTLKPKAKNATVLTEESTQVLVEALTDAPATVAALESKPYTRRPAAPFTTSSLQQEASRKLRLGARQAMRVAQSLYENGYITYMRTDSVTLSGEAIKASRAQAAELYGSQYVPDKPRYLPVEVAERPGGARGDPPRRGPLPHPRGCRRLPLGGRVPPVRADLEAHHRLSDGRRQGHHLHRGAAARAELPDRDLPRRRHRDHLPRLPRGL